MTGTLLVTSIVRGALLDEPSGLLFTVDLDQERVTGRCVMPDAPMRQHDANPRGGMRGAKGVVVVGDRIFIANHGSIHEFDRSWRLQAVLSDPGCAGIHDICHQDDLLWVTSTSNDRLFAFDLDGHTERTIDCRPNALSVEDRTRPPDDLDYRDPRTHDPTAHDQTHLNSVAFLPDGAMLVSLGRLKDSPAGLTRSTVRRIEADGDQSFPMTIKGTDHPSHSLCVLDGDHVAYLDTNAGDLLQFYASDPDCCSRIHVAEEFLRGMVRLSAEQVVVGGGASLSVIDLPSGDVRKCVTLCDDPRVSVYAIVTLPEGTAHLPDTLASTTIPRRRL